MFKKTLIVALAALSLTTSSLTVSAPAQAGGLGKIIAAGVVGAVIGSAIANHHRDGGWNGATVLPLVVASAPNSARSGTAAASSSARSSTITASRSARGASPSFAEPEPIAPGGRLISPLRSAPEPRLP